MTDQPSDPGTSPASAEALPQMRVDAPAPPATRPADRGRDGGRAAPPPVHSERRHRNMGWRSSDVLRTAALVIAFYLALRLLWFAQQLVLVTFLGILFGLAATAAVDRLARWRVPRGLGAVITVFGTVGLLVAFFAWTAPTLRAQSRELRTKLPEAVDKAQDWFEKRQNGILGLVLGNGGGTVAAATPAESVRSAPPDSAARQAVAAAPLIADSLRARAAGRADSAVTADKPGAGALRDELLGGIGSARRYLFSFVTSTFAVLGGVLLVLFLSVYVAASPELYHQGFMRLFPRAARPRAGEVLSAVAAALRRWLVTQLIAMIAIGTVTTVVLLLLGVRAALPLGILAGLLEFVPTIGPIMSAVPAIAMGFVDSPEKALWVAVAYVGIQFLENHILIPILMKEGVDLPPAVTIVTQALMALVFGFLGLLVAVPMLAAASVAVRMLYVEDVVGEPVAVPDPDDEA